MSIHPEIPKEPFMTPDQVAVLFKVALDSAEHYVDALPEGAAKEEATHILTRVHTRLSRLLEIAHTDGHVSDGAHLMSGGEPKVGP